MRIDQITDDEKRVVEKILLDRQIQMLVGGEEWSLTEAEEETYWVIFRKLGGKL